VRTPHRVRTLVRLTEDQRDWLERVGEQLGYLRPDGGVNVSAVVRELLERAGTECPDCGPPPLFEKGEDGYYHGVPFPPD
jgi:hypothetical protein